MNTIKKKFFNEVRKLPNREECKMLDEEEVRKIAQKVDFKTITEHCLDDYLDLKESEIPQEMFNQVILFVILMIEKLQGEYNLGSWEIFNMYDYKTKKHVKRFQENFSNKKSFPNLKEFLDYMKSDKPDL